MIVSWLDVAALRLARQHIVERLPAAGLLDVVREHVGIQAQVMSLAELQLNARLDGLRQADVRDALSENRTLVKTWAMRGTLHLIASDDLASFVAAAPTRGQWGGGAWLKYFRVTSDELATIFATVEEVLSGEPMTRAELVDAVSKATGRRDLATKLQSGWGSFLKPASHAGALVFGPDRGRNVTFVDPEDWLGRRVRRGPDAPDPPVALAPLIERFLRLFPGADRPGVGRWWGARAGMKPSFAHVETVEVDIEGSKGLILAADADALAATEPFMGVRLLPGFDAYVNDLPRRVDALLPIDQHDAVHRVAGWVSPVVIVDGRVAGTWELTNGKRRGIAVTPFGKLRSGAKKELKAEADRIAAFLDQPLALDVVNDRRRGAE
ncbi:MAG: DNA glycosylase AlkZ-like family protein [Chloroflexota bacterium]